MKNIRPLVDYLDIEIKQRHNITENLQRLTQIKSVLKDYQNMLSIYKKKQDQLKSVKDISHYVKHFTNELKWVGANALLCFYITNKDIRSRIKYFFEN